MGTDYSHQSIKPTSVEIGFLPPPSITMPTQVDFVTNMSFFSGLIGKKTAADCVRNYPSLQ